MFSKTFLIKCIFFGIIHQHVVRLLISIKKSPEEKSFPLSCFLLPASSDEPGFISDLIVNSFTSNIKLWWGSAFDITYLVPG